MADKETIKEVLETAAEALGLESSPQTPQRIESLTAMLALNPEVRRATRRQLSDAVSLALGESDFMPKPKAILKHLGEMAQAVHAPARAEVSCHRCKGVGAIPLVLRDHLPDGSVKAIELSGRCRCANGDRYRALAFVEDLERADREILLNPGPFERARALGIPLPERLGKVIPVRFTPNPEALDPHRAERARAEKQLKEEGWR